MRIVVIILGVAVAAAGGAIAYRSFFVEPHAAVVITNTSVRELPNMSPEEYKRLVASAPEDHDEMMKDMPGTK